MADFEGIPISPGTTWTDDVTGRTWTSFGSLILFDDSIQTVRQDLVAFLRGRLPEFNWYDYPPDNLHTPAVAISPSDPYILPYDAGGPDSIVWGFDLVLVTGRGKVEQSLRRLEFMFTEIQLALQDYPDSRWVQFSDIVTTEIASVEHLTGVLSIGVISSLKGTT